MKCVFIHVNNIMHLHIHIISVHLYMHSLIVCIVHTISVHLYIEITIIHLNIHTG